MGITINAKYLHVADGDLRLRQYADGTLAVQVEYADEDGYTEAETLSVNMSAYFPAPDEWHFYVKDYSDSIGLPDALVAAGVASKVGEPIVFGPFDTIVHLMVLAEKHRPESTLTPEVRNYEVGDPDDTHNDDAVHCADWNGAQYNSFVCTRYADHTGNHAAGNGRMIVAVWARGV